MSIVEFLEARIAEDEQLGRDAAGGRSGQWVRGMWDWPTPADDDDCEVEGENIKIYNEGGHTPDQAEHIATHDPARVLADCAAKRAIVGHVSGWDHEYNDGDSWYSCGLAAGRFDDEPGSGCADESKHGRCTCDLVNRQGKILVPLAAVYKDHPDYQQEWAQNG